MIGGRPSAEKVLIVQPYRDAVTETFIAAHRRLPGFETDVAYGWPVMFREQPVWPKDGISLPLLRYAALSALRGVPLRTRHVPGAIHLAYVKVLRAFKPAVVLAEYGPWGCHVLPACRALNIPLVVHFHGFDASHGPSLDAHRIAYRELFSYASGVIAVSSAMVNAVCSLGAEAAKVHLVPCGVDTDAFANARPLVADQTFLAVGRLVEKKAPLRTLAAFAAAAQRLPGLKLEFVGDGPLMDQCRAFIAERGLQQTVRLRGALPHD